VGAAAGQFHQVGDLPEAGLDPVTPLGDDPLKDWRHAGALVLGGRAQHRGAAGGLFHGERLAVEALVAQQVTWRSPGLRQAGGHVALVHCGGHDGPGPDDPRAEVGLDGQPEAVEPFCVRGVAAEPGVQAIRAGPPVGAADPGGVLDRQRGGIDLLAVVRRQQIS